MARWGDVMHLLAGSGAIAFSAVHILTDWMSPSFSLNGYCVSNSHSPWLNSHTLSSNLNFIFSGFLFWVSRKYGKELSREAMGPVTSALSVTVLHSTIHLVFGMFTGDEVKWDETIYTSLYPRFSFISFLFLADILLIFWGIFLFGVMSISSSVETSSEGIEKYEDVDVAIFQIALVLTVLQVAVIPLHYISSYNHLMAVLVICGIQCRWKRQGKYYNVIAALISTPLALFNWVEAFGCDSLLIFYGGHVWYDVVMFICLVCYVFVVLRIERNERKTT